MVVVGKISAKYQMTIPTEVREALGIDAGDRIVYRIDEEGKVSLESVTNVKASKVYGLLAQTNSVGNDSAIPTNQNASEDIPNAGTGADAVTDTTHSQMGGGNE